MTGNWAKGLEKKMKLQGNGQGRTPAIKSSVLL